MMMETIDLESGERTITTGVSNLSFSDDDDDVGSCISQLFSMHDGETEDPVGKLCSIFVDIDHIHGDDDVVVVDDDQMKTMRECRICQLTMESGMVIELGCSCKDDLGVAHKHCAETWFNIKGNRNCEICNSVAVNVFVISNESEATLQQTNDTISTTSPGQDHHRSSNNGHRLVNFILSCMIFAFSISWLFHLNVDS